jgi:hypothetical protein
MANPPLPNQKSKINNRKSSIHGRSAAKRQIVWRFTLQKSAVPPLAGPQFAS